MEQETISGFDIPKRELTDEEATREITYERFSEWHHEVGEDFVDQVGYDCGDTRVILGFFIAKFPEYSIAFLEKFNEEKQYFEPLSIKSVLEGEIPHEEDEWEIPEKAFYSTLAEFLNLTVHAKKRVNQVLIQVLENY